LQLSAGQTAAQVAATVGLTAKAVREIGRRYEQEGLERALCEKQRPGAVAVLEGRHQQRILAMVGSNPPEGYARWTVRLITQEAVKRKLVPKVGRETIQVLLQSHDLKPWREKNVVRGRTR
jgi:transposase